MVDFLDVVVKDVLPVVLEGRLIQEDDDVDVEDGNIVLDEVLDSVLGSEAVLLDDDVVKVAVVLHVVLDEDCVHVDVAVVDGSACGSQHQAIPEWNSESFPDPQ